MATIATAHREWANRPLDQRFWGLHDPEFLATAKRFRDEAEEIRIQAKALAGKLTYTDEDAGDNVIWKDGDRRFNHLSFGQLCDRAGRRGGRGYLPQLAAKDAVANLKRDMTDASRAGRWDVDVSGVKDEAIRERMLAGDGEVQVLLGANDVRAVTGRKYARLWNADLIQQVGDKLIDAGWKTPPAFPAWGAEMDPRARPATAEDLLQDAAFNPSGFNSVQVGTIIAPAGAYLSDRDMFLLVANPERGVVGPNGRHLMRAAIIRNSEVGEGSLWIQGFLLDFICGNHFLWGATMVVDVKAKHTSLMNLTKGLRVGMDELMDLSDASAGPDEAGLKRLAERSLGDTLDSARIELSRLLRNAPDKEQAALAPIGKKLLKEGTAIGAARAGYEVEGFEDVAADGRYGNDPFSAWSVISGLTEASQRLPHAGDRAKVDRAVGSLANALLA